MYKKKKSRESSQDLKPAISEGATSLYVEAEREKTKKKKRGTVNDSTVCIYTCVSLVAIRGQGTSFARPSKRRVSREGLVVAGAARS